jgi:hypothetical protein
MGDTFEWFLTGGDWYDRKQRAQILELQERQSQTTSRVNRELSATIATTGNLAERVDRLEKSLLALYELEDIREELNEHTAHAVIRNHARAVLLQFEQFDAEHEAAHLKAPTDDGDYWLLPAARWAAEVATATHGSVDRTHLDSARERDAVRSDIFASTLAGVIGRTEVAADPVVRLMRDGWHSGATDTGVGDAPVTAWHRTIWRAVAERRFGDDARSLLIETLRRCVHAALVSPDAIRSAVVRPTAVRANQNGAAHRLATLAQSVETDETGPTQAEAAATGQSKILDDDDLAELLATVVGEGAPGEVGVLDRMSRIRSVLASNSAVSPPVRRSIDTVVGATSSLVLADLADTGIENRALRAVALETVAPEILAWSDELLGASSDVVPAKVAVEVGPTRHDVGATGLEKTVWLAGLDEPVALRAPVILVVICVIGVVAVAVGLLVALGGTGGGWMIAILGMCAALYGGSKWAQHRSGILASVRIREHQIATVERKMSEAQVDASKIDAAAEQMATTAPANHRRIAERFGRPVTS